MRLLRARPRDVAAEIRLRRPPASSTDSPAFPESANRESPRPPQEVAHLIRESVRRSGALTARISTQTPSPASKRTRRTAAKLLATLGALLSRNGIQPSGEPYGG